MLDDLYLLPETIYFQFQVGQVRQQKVIIGCVQGQFFHCSLRWDHFFHKDAFNPQSKAIAPSEQLSVNVKKNQSRRRGITSPPLRLSKCKLLRGKTGHSARAQQTPGTTSNWMVR